LSALSAEREHLAELGKERMKARLGRCANQMKWRKERSEREGKKRSLLPNDLD
jgi:hypothetical protein